MEPLKIGIANLAKEGTNHSMHSQTSKASKYSQASGRSTPSNASKAIRNLFTWTKVKWMAKTKCNLKKHPFFKNT